MIRFAFRKGLVFLDRLKGEWTLEKKLFNHKLRLLTGAGEAVDLTGEELTERWRSGEWLIDAECLGENSNVFFTATPADLKSLSESDQAVAKGRFDFITEVRKLFKAAGGEIVSTVEVLQGHITAAAKVLKEKWVAQVQKGDAVAAMTLKKVTPPSAATLWRWWIKYRATRCVSKLIDARDRAGRKTLSEQRSVFEEACLEVFLNTQRKPGKAVWEAIKRKYKRINENVPAEKQAKRPSRATVYRWLQQLHHGVVLAARQGKAFAEKELRAALASVEVKHILERYEIDHTPVDVLLICKITKLVLGRPWLTLAIDRKSRMIVGFYLSFHAPSAYSVLYCLRMAILPKDHILKRYAGIRNRWPARGIPDLLVSDNGMELHADAIEVVTYELGIEQQYCGVADPEMKGAIERLFRTANVDLFHQLPGTVFSNPQHRADYPSEKLACLDLETFIEILVRWIVDGYHNTPHRGLSGYTPLQAWEADEANRVIELPAYPEQLETIVAISATRTVFHYGVDVDNLRYNSEQLQSIRHAAAKNPLVAIRSHESDVGYVHVQDPETLEFFKVPAVRSEYAAGLNRHVHLLVCAEARHRFGDGWRDEQLLEIKADIQAIVDAAIRNKRMATRKGAAVVSALDSEAVLSPEGTDEVEALEAAQTPIGLDVPPPAPATPAIANDDLPELVVTATA